MQTQTMALSADWLGDSVGANEVTVGNTIVGSASNNVSWCGDYWQWPTYYVWPSYWPYTPTKIRLTHSEVEHMRKAAKKDAKLRETFRKLTPHLEVEVDFPGEDDAA